MTPSSPPETLKSVASKLRLLADDLNRGAAIGNLAEKLMDEADRISMWLREAADALRVPSALPEKEDASTRSGEPATRPSTGSTRPATSPLVPVETFGCGCFYDSLGVLALPCARHKADPDPSPGAPPSPAVPTPDLRKRAEDWLTSDVAVPFGTPEDEQVLDAQHHNAAYDIIRDFLKLTEASAVAPSRLTNDKLTGSGEASKASSLQPASPTEKA